MFFDWILMKQITVLSTPFVLWETNFHKNLLGVFSGELGHKQKSIPYIFQECEHHKSKLFPVRGRIYKLEEIQLAFRKEMKP